MTARIALGNLAVALLTLITLAVIVAATTPDWRLW